MKLTFLGTGAGESYPGLWCSCPNCAYARKVRGKNIRAHSCAVLDDTILLDMGPTCFHQAALLGIDLSQITTLLITHCHEDHLYPKHLYWREAEESHLSLTYPEQIHKNGPRFTLLPELNIYGNAFTEEALLPFLTQTTSAHTHFTRIQEGVSFESDGHRITPIRGNHKAPGFAHGYIIEQGNKTMLYALDTGTYDPDMQSLVLQHTYNLVVMEGTTGLNEQYGGHMCLENNRKFKHLLEDAGCLTDQSLFVLTHLSPHWCPPHDYYEVMLERMGITLAYDGMTIDF